MSSRRSFRAAALGLAIAVTAALSAVPAAATQGYCGLSWGSLPKTAASTAVAPLTGVRAGRHQCHDRLVIDMGTPGATGYSVRYVSEVVQDGSGHVVPLRGGARLEVVAIAPAYDDAGNATYHPANQAELVPVAGWQTFRQVAWAGSYEGRSTIGLGVRATLPFRVFTLDTPGAAPRLVIDVAHFW